MATLADLNVVISATIDDFEAKMARVQSGIGRVGDYAKDAGQSLSTFVTLPLTLLAGASISALAKIDGLTRGLNAISTIDLGKQGITGLNAVSQAATATSERLKLLQDIARAPGIGFEQAVQGDIRLRAVGIAAGQSAAVLKEFANAIALTGGGAAKLDEVTVQLAQLSAKGKVLAQDLRPVIEAAPAVATALQKLYGTVDSETISKSLEKQGKSSKDFIAVLTDELGKLPRVTGGIGNSLDNFAQGATQSLAKLGDALNKAFNLDATINRLSDFITGLADSFATLAPTVQKGIFVFAGLAAAAGPVLFAFGAIAAAIPSVVAGFEVMGIASTAALGPIGLGVAAVAAAAFLIIDNWDALTAYFGSSGEGGAVFGNLAESVKNAVGEIVNAFSALNSGSFGGLFSAAGILKDLIQGIAVGFTAIADVVGGVVGTITRLFQGDFAGALEQAKRAVVGLFEPLGSLFGFIKQNTALKGSFQDLRDSMEAAGLAGAVMGGDLAAALGKATGGLGLLAQLEERLKAAKEARPALTTEADIAASNQLIASLEAQIKRLNELGIASKEMRDAYAAVQKSLRDVIRENQALGDVYDLIENKQQAIESGIKKLVDAGFSPFSREVRNLVLQLQQVPRLLGDIAQLSSKTNIDVKLAGPTALPVTLKPVKVKANTFAPIYDALLDFNDKSDALISSGMARLATTLFNGLGQLAAGTITVESFGGGLLSVIGQVCSQLGEAVIAIGIGMLGLKTAFTNPISAIAAGAALLVIGAALGGIAQQAMTPPGAGGGGGGGIASAPRSNFTPTRAPDAASYNGPAKYEHIVKFNLTGSQLTGALAFETDRVGRVVRRP